MRLDSDDDNLIRPRARSNNETTPLIKKNENNKSVKNNLIFT